MILCHSCQLKYISPSLLSLGSWNHNPLLSVALRTSSSFPQAILCKTQGWCSSIGCQINLHNLSFKSPRSIFIFPSGWKSSRLIFALCHSTRILKLNPSYLRSQVFIIFFACSWSVWVTSGRRDFRELFWYISLSRATERTFKYYLNSVCWYQFLWFPHSLKLGYSGRFWCY